VLNNLKLSNNEKILLVCIQLLASCGYACIDTSKLVVITSIESAGANKCDYYGYGNSGMTYNIWTSNCSK
jgi:Na+/H+-dicarboxylate symporter